MKNTTMTDRGADYEKYAEVVIDRAFFNEEGADREDVIEKAEDVAEELVLDEERLREVALKRWDTGTDMYIDPEKLNGL